MRDKSFYWRSMQRVKLMPLIACTLLMAAAHLPAADPFQGDEPKRGMCVLPGSWLGEVDIGARFFAQYNPDGLARGSVTIEWIVVDPTLFGNFPEAVHATQGVGVWRMENWYTYSYTWIAYGLDEYGMPVYAIKTSGEGTIRDCHSTDFDWVMEIFPAPLDPLLDDAPFCLAGLGTKQRIPIAQGTCD